MGSSLPLVSVLGLIIGSFLGAYTYRWPRGISVAEGRSFCPKCKKKIPWYDNIPLISYIFLGGKCRRCGKRISLRYPLIELTTALALALIALFLGKCGSHFQSETLCVWQRYLGQWALPYLLFVTASLVAVFVIDLESQLIPDSLVYFLFSLTFIIIVLFAPGELYLRSLTAFASAAFLLLINLLTKGKGMGLGDVKFALFGGTLLGWPVGAVWLFGSFVIGAVCGVILIVLGKAGLGQKIAFGPFLALSVFVAIFWGSRLYYLLIP